MPASTPRGYPYPLPTEPVAEGAAAIRALAERVDSNSALELIEVKTLTSDTVAISFTLPQIYRDLVVRYRLRAVTAGGGITDAWLRLNNHAGATYNTQIFYAAAAVAAASEVAAQTVGYFAHIPDGSTAAEFWGSGVLELPNYRAGQGYQSWRAQGSSGYPGGGRQYTIGGLTFGIPGAALTALALQSTAAPFKAGSSVALYGIK